MARKSPEDEKIELLKTSLIVQLGLAGLPQQSIRAIVGCDMNRVNAVMKHLSMRNRNRSRGVQKGKPSRPE